MKTINAEFSQNLCQILDALFTRFYPSLVGVNIKHELESEYADVMIGGNAVFMLHEDTITRPSIGRSIEVPCVVVSYYKIIPATWHYPEDYTEKEIGKCTNVNEVAEMIIRHYLDNEIDSILNHFWDKKDSPMIF